LLFYFARFGMSGETLKGANALHPFLQGGFRPFFFAAPIWGIFAIALWLLVLSGRVALPVNLDPLSWHRHEMLFGYAGGIIAGFLLTAIPNWSGRLPLSGMPLALLAGLWLIARIALLLPGEIGVFSAIALDVGFYLVLAFFATPEVIAARNRNLPIVVAVALLGLANLLDHADMVGLPVPAGIGWRLGFGVILMLIALVGGRIIPSFTTNWLKKHDEASTLPGDKLDRAAGTSRLGPGRMDGGSRFNGIGHSTDACRSGSGHTAGSVERSENCRKSAAVVPPSRLCLAARRAGGVGSERAWLGRATFQRAAHVGRGRGRIDDAGGDDTRDARSYWPRSHGWKGDHRRLYADHGGSPFPFIRRPASHPLF
jgi:hypothetical protein